jgi:hypothetical protein
MAPKHSITTSRFCSAFVSSVILVLFLASCTLPISFSSKPIPPSPTSPVLMDAATSTPPSLAPLNTPTIVPPSLAPLDTPTSVPASILPSATPLDTPTIVPPSATPLPVAAIASAPGTIAFAPGTTAGVMQGTIQPGQVITYTLAAEQFQPMVLSLESPNHDVFLGVIEPDGLVMVDASKKWTRWQWMLPLTGIYKIQVFGGATTEDFTLTTKIPQRVNFSSGANSITVNGTTLNGYVFSYALNCKANQSMTVSLNVPSSTAYLNIFGLATGSLLSSSLKATSGTVVLPQTQDYVIEVIPVNGQVVNYALTVSISSATSAAATNIVFTPGTTAGVVQGSVQPGQVLTYTLAAEQYQPMILNLESLNYDVTLGVFEPNGNVLVSSGKKWTHWQWLLPQTGLYTIQVIGGATTEDFTLTAKIPQRINFVPGTGSVTLYGTTVNGYVYSYVLKCNGNQSMTVSLDVPASKAYLDVFGLATGLLLNQTEKATSWTGVLPQYQDYIIEVIPRNGQLTSYTLTVSVH